MAAGRVGEPLTLLPGQWHFGGRVSELRTLLGSCVAIVLWHPVRRVGGMCHYLLPSRGTETPDRPEGRYGDEAVALMLRVMQRRGLDPAGFEAHLYGGADTMPDSVGTKFNIGERNIEAGWALIDRHGFTLQAIDVGDNVPRTVVLSMTDGSVVVRRGAPRRDAPPSEGRLR